MPDYPFEIRTPEFHGYFTTGQLARDELIGLFPLGESVKTVERNEPHRHISNKAPLTNAESRAALAFIRAAVPLLRELHRRRWEACQRGEETTPDDIDALIATYPEDFA